MKTVKISSSILSLLTVASLTSCIAAEDPQSAPSVGEHSSELARGAAQRHCVVASLAQPQDGATAGEANAAPAQCFETFPAAIAAATRGRVQLPPSATPETVDDRTLNGNAVTPSATFVIGIEFVDANFQGATLTITSSVTCSGFVHTISSMPSGWNDVISSAKAFSNCNNSFHFENINFGGAQVNCGTACGFVGSAMNDRTSSIRWTN
jgi:hypothetical protein